MLRNFILFWLIVPWIFTACGRHWGLAVPTQYSLDGVKRIAEGVASDDGNTWGQSSYSLNSTSRLLLRFESLEEHLLDIDTSNGKKVTIRLSLTSATSLATALTDLKLCPVTRSWMMLASWDLAHPFLGGEQWTNKGGDYETAGCVLPTHVSNTTATLEYDITQWYLDYPKGRGHNYGLIALSSSAFEVEGDQSGSYSPRIAFEE